MNWPESLELRKAIGDAAKADSGWFKSISKGQNWFERIAPAFDDAKFKNSDLGIKLTRLRTWVDHG